MYRVKQITAALCLCLLLVVGSVPSVFAGPKQSGSTNYGVSEVNFGSGGQLNACSTTYCSDQSAGDLAVGKTGSTNFSARGGGRITEREVFLNMIVTPGGINLGSLDSSSVKFGALTFSVRTFPAQGYNVLIAGQTPRTKEGHNLTAMSSATTSTPGTEQFGVNLKANTAPNIGADAAQAPDNTFAFGAAAAGYGTQNNYKFTDGDTIASSAKGYGQTNYTISVIANISTNTPAGSYSSRLSVIAVPTF